MTGTETTRAPTRNETDVRFVTSLIRLRDDSGAMAALRRGLGKRPGHAAEMHRYLLPLIGSGNVMRREATEDTYYLVASLFSFWHQGKGAIIANPSDNIGAGFACLKDESDSIEKRFVAMLNCHADDLPQHLRYAVGLLKTKDIPIDWVQLLADLRNWDHEDRFVQRRWARGFWNAVAADNAATPELTIETSSST